MKVDTEIWLLLNCSFMTQTKQNKRTFENKKLQIWKSWKFRIFRSYIQWR